VVLLITLVFMPAFVYIPLPCIAAILIVAATRLIPVKVIKQLWAYDMGEFIILLIVSVICVGVDGAIGLMVGAVISILRTAVKTSKAKAIQARTSDDGEVLILSFSG
jgi:MFS superfamily sulfate permease-like transporter